MIRPRQRTRRAPRFRGLSFNRMVPNILTLLALCAGLTSIRFGWEGRWEIAVYAIVVAGILDGLDGRIARLLKSTSRFGAELDSLSDFVSFGVAPGVLLFAWTLQDAPGIGWIACLMYSVCMALRLARFNTEIDEPRSPGWSYNFFTGVPAPAAALLALLPMMLAFTTGYELLFRNPYPVAGLLLIVSFLMVSRLPTYSLKNFKVPASVALPMLLGVAAASALLISSPWAMFSAIGVAYLGSLPFSFRSYRRLERQAEAHRAEGGDDDADGGGGPIAFPGSQRDAG